MAPIREEPKASCVQRSQLTICRSKHKRYRLLLPKPPQGCESSLELLGAEMLGGRCFRKIANSVQFRFVTPTDRIRKVHGSRQTHRQGRRAGDLCSSCNPLCHRILAVWPSRRLSTVLYARRGQRNRMSTTAPSCTQSFGARALLADVDAIADRCLSLPRRSYEASVCFGLLLSILNRHAAKRSTTTFRTPLKEGLGYYISCELSSPDVTEASTRRDARELEMDPGGD